MALKVKAKEQLMKVGDVKAGLITSRRIIFTPTGELKNELAATAVQITCYDKNGKEVKRVTSMSGEVEEEASPQPSPKGEGEQTGGDDNGGEEGPNL